MKCLFPRPFQIGFLAGFSVAAVVLSIAYFGRTGHCVCNPAIFTEPPLMAEENLSPHGVGNSFHKYFKSSVIGDIPENSTVDFNPTPYPAAEGMERRLCKDLSKCQKSGYHIDPSANSLYGSFPIDFGEFGGSDRVISVDDVAQGYQIVFERLIMFSYTNFLGVPLQQDPSDAFAIMDLMWRLKPDLVIELGTGGGGSAFFYAFIMAAYAENPHVVTMDPKRIQDWNKARVNQFCPHCVFARDTPLWRSSGIIHFFNERPIDMVETVEKLIKEWGSKTILVIDDSNHLTEVVLENINAYARFVTPGSYLIVQDTKMFRLNKKDPNVNPSGAVTQFLKSDRGKDFYIDRNFEYYVITQHPEGFLRRKG